MFSHVSRCCHIKRIFVHMWLSDATEFRCSCVITLSRFTNVRTAYRTVSSNWWACIWKVGLTSSNSDAHNSLNNAVTYAYRNIMRTRAANLKPIIGLQSINKTRPGFLQIIAFALWKWISVLSPTLNMVKYGSNIGKLLCNCNLMHCNSNWTKSC